MARSVTTSDSSVRWILRLLGLAAGVLIGLTAGTWLSLAGEQSDTTLALVTIVVALGGVGYVVGPHLSWLLFDKVKRRIASASAVDLIAIGVGLAFGALVSAPLAIPLYFLPAPLGDFLPFIFAVAFCSISVLVAWSRKRDLIVPLVRGRVGKAASADGKVTTGYGRAVLLDTNILIDGRVSSVIKSGFLDDPIEVPRFVLDELQRIADSDEPLRRSRGRRGLEVLTELKSNATDRFTVIEDPVLDEREVDAKLVKLARARGSRIVTNDFNLNRVAQAQGVEVLSLNDLSNALRPMVLPGEELSLLVVQEGREAGQGVGFLDDGTMVVIDGGRSLVGQSASVMVTRLLQTGAGRMLFATPKHAA